MLSITIDLARWIAALAVFLFHIKGHFTACCPNVAVLAKNVGFYGVAVFFVISGYCITSSADKASHHGAGQLSFLKKRFFRIYPPFWAALIITVLTPYLLESISFLRTGHLAWPDRDWESYGVKDWLQIASLARVFYGTEQEDLHVLFRGVNPVYWTLAIEFQFYLVMFFSLLTKTYWKKTLAIVTFLGFVAMYFPSILPGERSGFFNGLFLGYWPLFSIGIALYFLLKNGISLTIFSKHISTLISVLIVFTLTTWVIHSAFENKIKADLMAGFGSDWFGFALLSAMILWSLAPIEPYLRNGVESKCLVFSLPLKLGMFLGTISYSIYLLHARMYQVVEKAVNYLHLTNSLYSVLAIIMGTILISAIFYHFFEKPFIHYSKYRQ